MKTIGLIGGTTWASTADYYRIINQEVNRRLGGHNSAKILLYSVNFEELQPPADVSKWGGVTETLAGIAVRLEQGGAECLVLCANTPHLVAHLIQEKIRMPLIHIAEVTSKVIEAGKIGTVGLLGTKFTMEQSFFRDKLADHGIRTVVPEEADRDFIHRSIFTELGKGVFLPETKKRYVGIVGRLVRDGAKGIIFGCTEIPLLLTPEDCPVPSFDTTTIHANAAVDFALAR